MRHIAQGTGKLIRILIGEVESGLASSLNRLGNNVAKVSFLSRTCQADSTDYVCFAFDCSVAESRDKLPPPDYDSLNSFGPAKTRITKKREHFLICCAERNRYHYAVFELGR